MGTIQVSSTPSQSSSVDAPRGYAGSNRYTAPSGSARVSLSGCTLYRHSDNSAEPPASHPRSAPRRGLATGTSCSFFLFLLWSLTCGIPDTFWHTSSLAWLCFLLLRFFRLSRVCHDSPWGLRGRRPAPPPARAFVRWPRTRTRYPTGTSQRPCRSTWWHWWPSRRYWPGSSPHQSYLTPTSEWSPQRSWYGDHAPRNRRSCCTETSLR